MKIEKIKKHIIDFYQSDCYLALLVFLIMLFWATGREVAGTIVIVLLACGYMLIGHDLKPIVATVMLITTVYSLEQIETKAFVVMVAVLVPIVIAGFTYNLIHFKNKRNYVKGKLYYPMALAYVAALCGGLFFAPYNKIWTLAVFGVGSGIYFLYFLCVNCVEGDKRKIFAKILFFGGIIVSAQIIIWFLRRPDFIGALASKQLRVGWGMSNTVALVLVMAMPAVVYLGITQREYSFVMFPMLAILSGLLLITLSRGNILFGMPVATTCCIIGLIKSKRRVRFVALSVLIISAVFVLFALPMLKVIANKLFLQHDGGFFDDNGRIPLYKQAIDNFWKNPVFGVGFFKYKGATASDGPAMSFLWKAHNTIFQIIGCSGIVGVIGIMPFFTERYRLLIEDFSIFKLLALLSLLAYEGEGMVDVAFLSVHELFLLIGLFAAAEWESENNQRHGLPGSEKRAFIRYNPLLQKKLLYG